MASIVDSRTDIGNLALDHLGQAPINSLITPDSKTEKILDRWYDQTRRVLLETYDWNFAVKRDKIPKLSEAPAFGYEAKFQLPSDYISLLTVGDDYYDWHEEYTIEGNEILAKRLYGAYYSNSDQSLKIRYVRNYDNVPGMAPLFIHAFSLLLAANVCYKITNSNSKLAELKQDFITTMKMARKADAKASPVRRRNRFISYLENQGGGSSYGGYLWRE